MSARDARLSLGHGALPIMLAPIALVGPTAFSGGVGRNCIGEPTQSPAPEISVRQPEQRAGLNRFSPAKGPASSPGARTRLAARGNNPADLDVQGEAKHDPYQNQPRTGTRTCRLTRLIREIREPL